MLCALDWLNQSEFSYHVRKQHAGKSTTEDQTENKNYTHLFREPSLTQSDSGEVCGASDFVLLLICWWFLLCRVPQGALIYFHFGNRSLHILLTNFWNRQFLGREV